MIAADGRDIARMSRSGPPQMLINNALFGNGGLDGIETLADGSVVVTERSNDRLTRIDPQGPNQFRNRRTIDLPEPVKVLRAPNGGLYVASALGDLFMVDPNGNRANPIAHTNGHLRGLTYSPDFKTLYISDSGNKVLLSAKIRADGTVDPPVELAKPLGPYPDGIAADICGNIFVADNNGGPLLRVTAAGKIEMVSSLDGNDVAGLAFGSGKQGWDDHALYGVSDNNDRGAIYEIRIGVRGAPPLPFAQ
jgi:sugar lactone lactonase YvrE